MRFIYIIAVFIGIAVLGCSDGKLNLLLVLWDDHEASSSSREKFSSSSVEIPPSSSSEVVLPPSSSSEEEPSSSSSEEEPPSSSSEEEPPPSSSSEEPPPPSSSSRGPRSSSSLSIVDYPPPLEDGAPGVERAEAGGVTRYWDGCKPSCSRAENAFQQNNTRSPHGLARNCDRNGNEMPLYYRLNPVQPTWAEFIATPNACVPEMVQEWTQSVTYADWTAANPGFPGGAQQSMAYVCSADQIPYEVNDTLAYAFAANTKGNCGKCFQLQFRSDWNYGAARPSHRAIAGKTLIVMVSNFGVGESAFDLMIPGGGAGDYDAVSSQLGTTPANLGYTRGGLFQECIFEARDSRNPPNYSDPRVGLNPHERATLEESQDCLRAKCYRAFGNHPVLLKGCLWHADWFMAVDNPEAIYKEVTCPKYLIDRYSSTLPLPTRPENLIPSANCKIGGVLDCPAP